MGIRKTLLIASTALVLPWAAAASPFLPAAPVGEAAALGLAQGASDLLHEAKDRKDWWDGLLAGEEGGEWSEEGGEWGEEGGERSSKGNAITPNDHGGNRDWFGNPIENGEQGERGEHGEEGSEEGGEEGGEGG